MPGRNNHRVGSTRQDRITATEIINGVEYLVVLQREASGRYREISVTPVHEAEPSEVDAASYAV